VHWESDVIEGSFMGAATVARLHDQPEFLADLEAAKSELVAARAKNLPPQNDCIFEAEALAKTPPQGLSLGLPAVAPCRRRGSNHRSRSPRR
jgi:acid phosphatase (class A)